MSQTEWSKNQAGFMENMSKYEEKKQADQEKLAKHDQEIKKQAYRELAEHDFFQCEIEGCDMCKFAEPIQIRSIQMHKEAEDSFIAS